MAAIAATVALGAGLAPAQFLRLFGVDSREVTGVATFGWRLFAVRIGYLSARAMRGDAAARDAFLPIQFLDQAVIWHAFATRSVPRRASLLAAGTSAAIIALDHRRRAAERNA
jgi:hypothetical protein